MPSPSEEQEDEKPWISPYVVEAGLIAPESCEVSRDRTVIAISKPLAPEDESRAIQKQKGLTVLNVSNKDGEQEIVTVESDKFLGATIGGKFQILTLLGRGGMSCVY